MFGLSRKRVMLHKAASFTIFALYLVVTTSIDLFHSDDCVLNNRHPSKTDGIFSNDACPACTFLAGHHSNEVNQSPSLLTAERLFISKFLPCSSVVSCNGGACSIIARAPPSTTIS
jgi:hypothetical protein